MHCSSTPSNPASPKPKILLACLLACLLARRLGRGPKTLTPALSSYAKVRKKIFLSFARAADEGCPSSARMKRPRMLRGQRCARRSLSLSLSLSLASSSENCASQSNEKYIPLQEMVVRPQVQIVNEHGLPRLTIAVAARPAILRLCCHSPPAAALATALLFMMRTCLFK